MADTARRLRAMLNSSEMVVAPLKQRKARIVRSELSQRRGHATAPALAHAENTLAPCRNRE
jgi:hypothetical protein